MLGRVSNARGVLSRAHVGEIIDWKSDEMIQEFCGARKAPSQDGCECFVGKISSLAKPTEKDSFVEAVKAAKHPAGKGYARHIMLAA